MSTAFSLDQLIERLAQLRARYPECAARPVVHTVDPDGHGLLTDVEVDCFDERQGRVTSLVAWGVQ